MVYVGRAVFYFVKQIPSYYRRLGECFFFFFVRCEYPEMFYEQSTRFATGMCWVNIDWNFIVWVNYSFKVDLRRLSECSEYFRALSQSRMRETSEALIQLVHVSSSIFYNLLEFSFRNKFKVPREELDTHIQVHTSYNHAYLTMSLFNILWSPLQIHCCDSPQNLPSPSCFLSLWLWRSVAISWLRPSYQSACQSWQMNSAQVTVGPIWVWLGRSAVQSWRWQCSPTWVETCWRCPILSSIQCLFA